MKLEDVSLTLVKYKFAKFELVIPGYSTNFSLDSNFISNVIIDKDFEDYLFPFFEIDVTVPSYIYRDMKANNNKLFANIDLQKAAFASRNSDGSNLAWSSYFNDKFYVYMADKSPEVDSSVITQEEKDNGTYKTSMSYGDNSNVRLLLYKNDYFFNAKNPVNAILSNCTIIDGVTYVLNAAGLTKVLVSPPTNYKSYSELVITPTTAMVQLDRLCNTYALHKNGTLQYYDLDRAYLIDRSPACTAYATNEYKTTYLVTCPTTSFITEQSMGCYSNATEKYNLLNIAPSNLNIKDLASSNDQIYGNNFTAVSAYDGTITSVSSGATSAASASTNPSRFVIIQAGENTTAALSKSLNEASRVATLGFTAVDLNMLTPNKEFVLTIDDTSLSSYNGKYRITKMAALLTKEGDYFTPTVTAEFRG